MFRPSSKARTAALCLLSFLSGAAAWSGHTYAIPMSLIVFPLLNYTSSRRAAFTITLSYYAGSTWPVLPGAATFFGPNTGPIEALTIWIIGSTLLSLPIAVLWTANPLHRAWRIPLAITLTAVPPLGIIDVASPLTAAGVLFPGTSWRGLVLIVTLIGMLSLQQGWDHLQTLLPTVACALFCNFIVTPAQPPANWRAINTTFHGAGLNTPSTLDLYSHEMWIRNQIATSDSKVLIFPESIIYRWTSATDLFWKPELDDMRANGRSALIGASLPLPGYNHYLNSIIIRGQDTQTAFLQRIPVPQGMWKPFDPMSVPMRPFGPSTIIIAGRRVAPLICYEQLLVWPILASEWHKPTVLIGLSNDYWAKNTYIPEIQYSALQAWARLFHLPLLNAVNK